MDRRLAIAAVFAVATLARSALAQKPASVYRIGVLGARPGERWTGFIEVLRERNWIEGRNVEFIWRWSEGKGGTVSRLAQELVMQKVDVIVTEGTLEAREVKKATAAIPVVIAAASDPVGTGLVASLARPGGNITGSSTRSPQLLAKQVEFLKELVSNLRRVSVLRNPANPAHAIATKEVQAACAALQIKVHLLAAGSAAELERALQEASVAKSDGLIVLADVLFDGNQEELARRTIAAGLPAVYNKPFFAEVGGLIAYGPRFENFFRQAGVYVDRILKGAKPSDLPIEQPSTFDLVLNAKTAKALGIQLPASMLLRADRVIH